MKKKFQKLLNLSRYGQRFRLQYILGLSFFILGLIMQICAVVSASRSGFGELEFGFLLSMFCGEIFVLTAAVMPAQVLLSLDCTLLVQTSPWKKKLQTGICSVLSCIPTLIALTISLTLQLIAAAKMPANAVWLAQSFLICGIIAAFLLIFWPICYKYYRVSMVILLFAIICMEIGIFFSNGWLEYNGIVLLSSGLPASPAVCIFLAYAAVLAAFVVNYLLSLALYKKPLSKKAFGVLMQNWM